MKLLNIILLAALTISITSCKENTSNETKTTTEVANEETTKKSNFEIYPVSHATMVLKWDDNAIYIDPVGGPENFDLYDAPDLILITDIHGDHLNVNTVQGILTESTKIIAPQAVVDKLPEDLQKITTVLSNDNSLMNNGFDITAIPMYNLREEALKFHSKGRGNGYVIEKEDKRVYISGDTEDIPEMRNLANIDIAFICMNLPYTMTVESAASAVLDFKPETVFPYHYRGTEGLSDVSKFKELVNNGDSSINVTQLDWYPTVE